MKKQINDAIEILKKQDINGCITGSCLLDYFEGQDVDVFVYDKSSFNKLLFFMHYNSLFQILDPLEENKFKEYINDDKSSLDSLGLITIKFKYNLCVDINIIYKKFNKNIFDVISNFDLDIVAAGWDIKTKQYLSLRESNGYNGSWNKWNPYFYKTDFWSIKKLIRQFERIVKYTERGYNLDSATDKYISIVENIIEKENYYKTEKGIKYFNDTIEQFEIVLKILQNWKKCHEMTKEQSLILKSII